MRRKIIECDYCGKQIDRAYTLLPAREYEEEGIWAKKPGYEPYDMCRPCLDTMLKYIAPKPLEKKEKAQEEPDPEETYETTQDTQVLQQAPKADAALKQQAIKKKITNQKVEKIDHGRIVALYKAKPPRSIKWIANDCKCSEQTVINHLVKEGIYKTKADRITEAEMTA